MTDPLPTHVNELISELEDSLGSEPALGHVLSMLLWGVHSLHPDAVSRTDPAAVKSLTAETEKGTVAAEPVDDANDAAFTEAADLVADLAADLASDRGRAPTLNQLLDALSSGLSAFDVSKLEADTGTTKGKRPSEGDVVAIPIGGGRHRLAVMLERNRFGVAFGLFKGEHPLTPSLPAGLEPERHPVHTDDDAVRSGRWAVIGHDDGLRSKFSRPEIFHEPDPDDHEIGEYGSGETEDGRLRDLDKQEAEELGVLSGDFDQVFLSEELETRLSR
jgi:hypothetical protein